MRIRHLNQMGYNIVELLIAVAIMGAMASAVISARSYMAKQTVKNTDKAYGTQKAIQMFEELKALVNGSELVGVAVLDNYSDGSQFNPVLTTDRNVDLDPPAVSDPSDPLSGNIKTNGNWRYLRQVQIKKVANDPYVRQVTIKVFRYAGDNNPTKGGELLSTVGGMMRTITSLYDTTQVQDIYVIAVANIQAWWAVLPSLYNTMVGVIDDIQSRNPGLEFRTHYITRAAYGRDPQYIPSINKSAGTQSTTFPWVYFYPGPTREESSPNGSGQNSYFFDPNSGGVLQDGNFNVDGSIVNTGFSVADQFNHGVRYPDELAAYQAVTAAVPPGSSVPEISERMLIEGMLSTPQSFTNAMILNLHGELLPLPPMRNYSDAAKDPANVDGDGGQNVRVVTHPENIYYPTATTANVNLRVYAYYDGLWDPTTLPADQDDNPRIRHVSILLPDLNISAANIAVTAITDKWVSGTLSTYNKVPLPSGFNEPLDNQLNTHWTMTSIINGGVTQTLIELYDTRLRCSQAADGGGLASSQRLYNLEYIPCIPRGASFTGFELTNTSTTLPKNTARWIIGLKNVPVTTTSSAFGVVQAHVVETRLGDAITVNNAPPNLDRTYFWVGNNNPPPTTEQFQFLGDPRHCPYQDVKLGGAGVAGAATTIQAYGYNWYFKNFGAATTVDGYAGFDRAGAVTGWGPDHSDIDVPRYYKMIRDGIMKTSSIWSTTNGWSFYYFGIGGEFGFDHPPFSGGITFQNAHLWQSSTSGGTTTVCEIIDGSGSLKHPRIIAGTASAGTASQWHAKPWLGELYPDNMYSTWATIGNLPSWDNPVGFSRHFYREEFKNIYSAGTTVGFRNNDVNRRAQGTGCTSFFDGLSGGGSYQHTGAGTNANAYALATTCYGIFQYPMAAVVPSNRPWNFGGSGTPGNSQEWSIAPYSSHTTLSIPAVGGTQRLYYDSDNGGTWNASGVVEVTNGTDVGYVVETGTSPSANTGVADLAKTTLIFVLRTFLDGGLIHASGTKGHITQLPLIKVYPVKGSPSVIYPIPQFSNPTSIDLMVGGAVLDASGNTPTSNVWYRYPGVTSTNANYYTEEYPNSNQPVTASTYSESVSLLINIKYSPDGGKTWRFVQDNAAAYEGILDTTNSRAITNGGPVTNMVYTWDVSNTAVFPQGDYTIRAEAYRLGLPLHYAYHKLSLTINR